MKTSIEDLCRMLELKGRKVNDLAVERLVRYWSTRTPYTASEVCNAYIDDIRIGWGLSMRRRGFV